MKWWPRKPKNLLGRTLLVEVTLTMDLEGKTKIDMTTLDPTTPIVDVIKAVAGGAGALGLKAEELAQQAGLDLKRVLG